MIQASLKRELIFSLFLTVFVGLHRADDSDGEWDIEDPALTEEIEQITDRPEPYKHTPYGFFPHTDVTPPEAYYEAEYADKPCQDKAEGKILARNPKKKIPNKNNVPEVIVDHLKVEKVNGAYKVQQKLVPSDLDNCDAVEKKLAGNDNLKDAPIGDNIQNDKMERMKANGIVARGNNVNNGQQINMDDIQEGNRNPIGDNVKPVDPSENEVDKENRIVAVDSDNGIEQMKANGILARENNAKNVEQINMEDMKEGKNDPIGDKVKPVNPSENEIDKPNPIIAEHSDKNEEQINMKDVMNDIKEETLDENKKISDQKAFEVINNLKSGPNMKKLYNIAEETKDQNSHQKVVAVNNDEANKMKNNVDVDDNKANKLENKRISDRNEITNIEKDLIHFGKPIQETVGSHLNKHDGIGKPQAGCKNSPNDFEIKIKLERFDDAKSNLNNQVNSLVDLGRKSLSGLNTFQNLVNKIMPFAQNNFNMQNSLGSKLNPQNFYMKYLQIDPARNELKYEYYFFQKYVNNRYSSANAPADSKSPSSLLMSKLLGQLLSPTSLLANPLSFLSPLSFSNDIGRKLPIKIFMNEKSAAKYQRNQANAEKQKQTRTKRDVDFEVPAVQRVKRNVSEEPPLFNEGPFKVEEKDHVEWAKDFLREFPKEDRPTSYRVIHQQPSSTDVLQWYHPFPGEEVTFYTVEPLATRTTDKEEPEDMCKCHHWKTPEPKEDDIVHRAGE